VKKHGITVVADFQLFFEAKSFQQAAVEEYLTTASNLPSSSRYNSKGRAYPDVSAQSVAYIICYELGFYSVSGTSCSCPSVAGMVSLINDARLANGKSRLGWLNPLLYHLYSQDSDYYFNDVTSGYNMGCDSNGIAFYANEGWDPITGVGTLKFSRLYEYLANVDTGLDSSPDGSDNDIQKNPKKLIKNVPLLYVTKCLPFIFLV